MYVVIGDAGNIEGPYRTYVDQIDPTTNATYCEALSYDWPNQFKGPGLGPNAMEAAGGMWGPPYQTASEPPNCTTLTWQPAYGVDGGPPLVMKDGSDTLGFCQSSQPKWSAYRNPSFGLAIMEIESAEVLTMSWYPNQDGGDKAVDTVRIERLSGCKSRR